jgi:hypothetical protein
MQNEKGQGLAALRPLLLFCFSSFLATGNCQLTTDN